MFISDADEFNRCTVDDWLTKSQCSSTFLLSFSWCAIWQRTAVEDNGNSYELKVGGMVTINTNNNNDINIKGELHNRFNLISEERVKKIQT